MKKGQTVVLLLIISLMLTLMVTTMVAVVFSLTKDTTIEAKGERAVEIAESGVQNAILKLLRDPSYTGEANVPIGEGTVTIAVTGTATKNIEATSTYYEIQRKITAGVTIANGQLSVVSWSQN